MFANNVYCLHFTHTIFSFGENDFLDLKNEINIFNISKKNGNHPNIKNVLNIKQEIGIDMAAFMKSKILKL